jgi:ribosomal protein L7/L12
VLTKIVVFFIIVVAIYLIVSRVRVNRIDRMRQEGVSLLEGQETEADVEQLIRMGHEIQAIKLYRDIHGVDLKTAKDAVEELAAEIRKRERPAS